MTTEVTFYKLNFINGNSRAVNGTAMKNILDVVSTKITFPMLTDTDVQPDVPFYFDCEGIDVATLNTLNYLSYTHNNYTYYGLVRGFTVSNQPNGKGNLTACCYHHIDIFAMYGSGIPFTESDVTDSASASGTMIRGHVDDIQTKDWSTSLWGFHPTIKHTLATAEEPVNTSAIKTRRILPDFSDGPYSSWHIKEVIGWLYIYVANAHGVSSWSSIEMIQTYDNGVPTGGGIQLCYPIIRSDTDNLIYIVYYDWDVHTFYNFDGISELTSEYITAFSILPTNPYNCSLEKWIDMCTTDTPSDMYKKDYVYCEKSIITDGTFPLYMMIPTSIPHTEYTLTIPDDDDVYPEYTQNRYNLNSDVYYYWGSEYGLIELLSGVSTSANFDDYLQRYIIKTHTAPYVTITSNGNPIVSVLWNEKIEYFVDVSLATSVWYLERKRSNQEFDTTFKTLVSGFAPTVTLDYWTRLNATQESILAEKSTYTAWTSAINSGISTIASAVMGNASGIINGASSFVTNMGSAFMTTKYNNNVQEIAQHQYDTGETKSDGAFGQVNFEQWQDSPSVTISQPIKDEADRLNLALALRGYVCSIPLRNLGHHQRANYNYVECTDYQRYGLATDVLEEFKQIFAQGVWLWHDKNVDCWIQEDNPLYTANFIQTVYMEDTQ